MWDDLDNYRPLPTCNCSTPCVCKGEFDKIKGYRDQDYTIQFLKGINDQYSHVKSKIMLMNPLPDVTKAFSMVTQ